MGHMAFFFSFTLWYQNSILVFISAAVVYLAEDGTGQQLVLQELRRQRIDVNCIQEGMQIGGSALHIPAYPVCAGFIHLMWILFKYINAQFVIYV